MARNPQDVTDAELAILQALWDGGPATIRQLTDLLYPGGGTSHYATVQKLLERLEAKGCVQRQRLPSAHRFAARVARGDLIGRRLEEMADKLCGGSMTPLLTHLLRGRRLSRSERAELRALIDELDRENRPKSDRA
jgi:predicted transcriptional regulator